MAISYLISLEEFSVLAHFCGYDSFPSMPQLPVIDREKSDLLINNLVKRGMIHIHNNEAAVDLALSYVLSVMVEPINVIKGGDGTGYCGKDVWISVKTDRRNLPEMQKYKITPFPSKEELYQWICVNEEV